MRIAAMNRRTFMLGCALAPFTAPAFSASLWPRGYVSLTYDDGLASQLDIAVPQLEAASMRGTFYLTWDNMSDRADDWAALARRGHELANHTMTHPCDLQSQSTLTFANREIDPMQRWLSHVEGADRGRDYAYPCDVTNLGPGNPNQQAHRYAQLLLRTGIRSARTSEGPPNTPRWSAHAPYRLHALALAYDTKGEAEVRDYLKTAMERGDWAILVVHQIGTGVRSDGFIAPAEHEAIVAMISDLKIPCGTVESALRPRT